MKSYIEFVRRAYAALSELYEIDSGNMYGIFAEGPVKQTYSQNQEYAILRNEYAELFIVIIQNHLELLEISDAEYQVENSNLYPNEVKIVHSCYPKNLRRWLSGTISRKKKCRIEFCVLVWCHAIGWNLLLDDQNEKQYKCRQDLERICADYLPKGDVKEKEISFEMLWKASTEAYFSSFR